MPTHLEDGRVKILQISPLSEPTFANYSTGPSEFDHPDAGKHHPILSEPIAMWALIIIDGVTTISGIHLRDVHFPQFCAEAANLLGYTTVSWNERSEREYDDENS